MTWKMAVLQLTFGWLIISGLLPQVAFLNASPGRHLGGFLTRCLSHLLWLLSMTPSAPWLHLEILSIKVMNIIGDEEQPWGSPTPTGNGSD